MAIEKTDIANFIRLAKANPILDARSPGEFNHAHFPGAYNLALFTDEERKVVGTAYKQQGREKAIKLGLDYFGIKMRKMVEEAEEIARKLSTNIFLIHCWRGGMRSEAIAWLLDLYGFKIYLLHGGYKKFRRYVLETFNNPFNLRILSGFTGSGKTHLLNELLRQGQATIDLENIANHKGSTFGAIDQAPQPSQEMFENILAVKLTDNLNNTIWIEDESRRIGTVNIPPALWEQMQRSPVFFLDIPFAARLLHIEEEYGKLGIQHLVDAVLRIQKRLGGLETKTVINYLLENNMTESFSILLKYYDKCYLKTLTQKDKVNTGRKNIIGKNVDVKENVALLMQAIYMTSDMNI